MEPKNLAATGTALVRIGWILFITGCLGVLLTAVRSSAPTQPGAGRAPETPIVAARRIIPEILPRIYEALDQGNPSAAASFLSPKTRSDFRVLDDICRPFTYRAHYIERINERSDNRYTAWVRVLFKPLEEDAYVLVFLKQGNSFLLDGIADPPDNWFGGQMTETEQIGRNFLFALGAGKDDIAMRYLSPGLGSSFYSAEVLNDVRDMHVGIVDRSGDASLKSHQGIKINRCFWMWSNKRYFFPDYETTLLFEPVDGQLKIVSWARKCGWFKDSSTEVDDPDLEARTLQRFGLQAATLEGR